MPPVGDLHHHDLRISEQESKDEKEALIHSFNRWSIEMSVDSTERDRLASFSPMNIMNASLASNAHGNQLISSIKTHINHRKTISNRQTKHISTKNFIIKSLTLTSQHV